MNRTALGDVSWAKAAVMLLGLLLSLTACFSIPTLDNSPSNFPFDLMLTVHDLPSGWYYDGGGFPKESGADSREAIFGGSPDPQKEFLLVNDELSVYPDEQAAMSAYADWEKGWFPTSDWKRPSQAQFVPQDSRDQYRCACIDEVVRHIPIHSCTYLQQHKQFISLILVNIDEQTITLQQFEQALKNLDERLQRR